MKESVVQVVGREGDGDKPKSSKVLLLDPTTMGIGSPLLKKSLFQPIDSPRSARKRLEKLMASAVGGGGLGHSQSTGSLPNLPEIGRGTGGGNGAASPTHRAAPQLSGATGSLPAIDVSEARAEPATGAASYAYTPVIRLGRRSQMGMRPLHAGP